MKSAFTTAGGVFCHDDMEKYEAELKIDKSKVKYAEYFLQSVTGPSCLAIPLNYHAIVAEMYVQRISVPGDCRP